jgi:hypothetical protein
MKKLSQILKEIGPGAAGFVGNAKDGGKHHFSKTPRSKDFEHFPYASNDFPYVGQKNDFVYGNEAAEEGEKSEEEELPTEALGMSDQMRGRAKAPPTAPWTRELSRIANSDPGKGSRSVASRGPHPASRGLPSHGDEDAKEELMKGRTQVKVGAPSTDRGMIKKQPIQELVGGRQRIEQGNLPASTKQPFANGLPASDKFQPTFRKKNGVKIKGNQGKEDEFIDRDQKDVFKRYIEEGPAKASAMSPTTDFDRTSNNKKANRSKNDLEFWEKIKKISNFLMVPEENFEEKEGEDEKEELPEAFK